MDVDELRDRLARLPQVDEKFRQLMAEIAALEVDDECAASLSMMDVLVTESLQGHDAKRQYPHLWRHMQTCQRCHTLFGSTLKTLQSESQEPSPPLIPAPPARLPSFLQLPREDVSWVIHPHSSLLGTSSGVTISWGLNFLRSLVMPSPQPIFRSAAQSMDSDLLLHETVEIEGQPIVVDVIAIRRYPTDRELALQVHLVGDEPLPAALQVKMEWGRLKRSVSPDEAGEIDFGSVPLDVLSMADQQFGITVSVAEGC